MNIKNLLPNVLQGRKSKSIRLMRPLIYYKIKYNYSRDLGRNEFSMNSTSSSLSNQTNSVIKD